MSEPAESFPRPHAPPHVYPSEEPYAIGCDVGVTNVKTVCVSASGAVLSRQTADTNADSPDWAAGVVRHVRGIEDEHGPARWVGVAAPGIAAPDGKAIWWMSGRLDSVQGLDWGA